MAVDPQRLQAQLDQLAELAADPERLPRAALELLEGYQVRRRSSGRMHTSVPQPVLRAVARGLRAKLGSDRMAAEAAATALWDTGRSEARSLAARLLADQEHELVADLVERWARSAVPLELLKELADSSLQAWRRAAPDRFLQRSREWLDGKHRLLGLYALRAAVRDPRFENLPRIYELVEGLGGKLRGRPRRALLELMRALVKREPTETVQFLRDELTAGEPAAGRLVRDLLPSLAPEQRQALRAANGIIRARADRPQGGRQEP